MRKLALFTAGFASAVAAMVYGCPGIWILWVAGGAVLLSVLCRRLAIPRLAVVLLGIAAGLLWTRGYQQLYLSPLEPLAGQELPVRAELLTEPAATQWGSTAEVRIDCGTHSCRALLVADPTMLERQPGDVVTCHGTVQSAGRLPLGPEQRRALAGGMRLVVTTRETTLTGRKAASVPVRLQLWLQEQIHRLYTGQTAAFLRAMLTGDRGELTYRSSTAFSLSGISHVIAVSGMHLALLVTMTSLLCFGSPRLTALVGCPIMVLFALMTGASPSVCRAAVMQGLLLCAPLARRQNDPATSLSAALLVLLLQNPWSAASVSLQMSFAAVAGLYLFAGPVSQKLLSVFGNHGRLRHFICLSVATTFSATVMTLPLSWLYFGTVSLAAPVTNVLVLWAVSLILPLGLLSLVTGPVGKVLALPVGLLCRYVLGVSSRIAAFPYAAVSPENLPLLLWTVAVFFLMLLWLLSDRKRVHPLILSGLLASLLACMICGRQTLLGGPCSVTVLDVGQGQCLILQLEDCTAVVDCGGSDGRGAAELAARTLRSAGIGRIDALILTHFDRDHVGGVPYLLDQMAVNGVYYPAAGLPEALQGQLESRNVPCHDVAELTEMSFPNGKITVYPPVSLENDNNSGICVLATAEEYDILITGDMDQMAELQLLSRWEIPQVELLVAGHHGARDSTCPQLLKRTQPETVVISAGAGNDYGHPHRETLERLEAAGAAVFRTDLQGTILLKP